MLCTSSLYCNDKFVTRGISRSIELPIHGSMETRFTIETAGDDDDGDESVLLASC